MIQLRFTLALPLLLAGAFAQQVWVAPPGPEGVMFQGGDFVFLKTELAMEGKVVKGAPYSAQAVTEFTQTLADGNRIHRTSTTSLARDSEGRTRREQTITAMGPLANSGDTMKSVFIRDPVAGVSYTLEPNSHVARASHEKTFMVESSSADGNHTYRIETSKTE